MADAGITVTLNARRPEIADAINSHRCGAGGDVLPSVAEPRQVTRPRSRSGAGVGDGKGPRGSEYRSRRSVAPPHQLPGTAMERYAPARAVCRCQ
ncbi:hypothetical protein ACQEVY_05665 [Streptomyces sp. CA-288835]|uniref:hypothetical protein n=1 Tax=Streptomyces sp. CA-288835 TaxID=3240069 RepID=UPI003D9263BD